MEILREFLVLLGLDVDDSAFKRAEKQIAHLQKSLLLLAATAEHAGKEIGQSTDSLVKQTKRSAEWREAVERGAEALDEQVTQMERWGEQVRRNNKLRAEQSRRTEEAAERTERATERAVNYTEAISGVRRTVLYAGASVVAFSAGVAAATRDFVQQSEEIDAWAAKIGESTETLSALKVLLESTGTSAERGFETITDAAERVGDTVLNVKKLTGDAGEALARLGFRNVSELKDANGQILQSLPLFKLLASRLADVEDAGQRTGIAMQLFGDQGRDLIPFINRYGKEMDGAIESSMRFGAIVGKDDVKAARDFRAAYGGAIATLRGMTFIIGRRTLPAVSKYLRSFSDLVLSHREMIAQKVEGAITKVGRATSFAWSKVKQYAEVVGQVTDLLGGLQNTLLIVGGVLGLGFAVQVGAAVMAVNRLLVALEITKLALLKGAGMAGVYGLALAAFVLVIDDVITTIQGGDSVIGRFVERFDPSGFDPNEWGPVKAMRLLVGYLRELVSFPAAVVDRIFGSEEEKRFAQDYMNKAGGRILKIQSSLAKDIAGAVTLNPDGLVAQGIEGFLSGGTGDFYARGLNGAQGFVEDVQRFNPSDTDFVRGMNARLQSVSDGFVGRSSSTAPSVTTINDNRKIEVNGSGLSRDELMSATEEALSRSIVQETR